MRRRYRAAFAVTFRRYGASSWDIGVGRSVSWEEACFLLEAALADTGTELFAAVQGWRFPMSMPDMLLVTAAFGKDAYKVMPFDPEGHVSDVEVEQAHEELLSEIKFG